MTRDERTARFHPYAPRRIRYHGLREHAGWRLKAYSVSVAGPIEEAAFAAGTSLALAALPQPARNAQRTGAGLLISHQGRGMNYVVLGWWDRENELPLRLFVQDQTPGAAWRPAEGAESVCVWDLEILWQERVAWVETVLAQGEPQHVEAYLARHAFETEAADSVAFDELWNYDDPAATEARFRELLPQLEAEGETSRALQLRTQIARTLGLQRRFDDASATLDAVEVAPGHDEPVVRVRTLLERGRVSNSSGAREEARPRFEEAWEIARASQLDALAVDAAHMVAIASDGDEALRWNEIGLDLARASKSARARKWRGSLLNNLGWTWHDRGDFGRALALFEEAVAVRREEGTPKQLDIALWCVARCLRSLGRVEEALAAQRSLLAAAEAAGEPPSGYVYEELGECTLLLTGAEAARPFFARAYEMLSADAWLAESEPARLDRLRELGGLAQEVK